MAASTAPRRYLASVAIILAALALLLAVAQLVLDPYGLLPFTVEGLNAVKPALNRPMHHSINDKLNTITRCLTHVPKIGGVAFVS